MEQVPWVEKYRPSKFESIILDENNKIILENMLKEKLIPNLLFYGPPGTGKTTTIINFINKYQLLTNEHYKELVIHLNASDDRGIDTIRNQICDFTKSSYLFNKGIKFIILDEIDYMTKTAQISLYNLMKEEIPNVRFCLICNYISKLDRSLQNICMHFKFNSLPHKDMKQFLVDITKKEQIQDNINENIIESIILKFKSDIRSMINFIQGISQNEYKPKIISKKEIETLISYFKNNTVKQSEKKMESYLYNYNIEKSELVLFILRNLIESDNIIISKKLIKFIKCITHCNNYYLDSFNKFFISNLVSVLST